MRPQNRTSRGGSAERGVRDAAEAERTIAELAAKQCGVVNARQLHALGFGGGAIKRRLRAGRFHRVHRGVYLVGHAAAAQGAAEMAAVLTCGTGSVVSHRSAGRIWAFSSLVVEVDGYAYHSGKRAFERDRERDAALVAAGHAVIRITWRQLAERPEAVIARIAAALAIRSICAAGR